jgi:translocation and assembly module TamB
MNVELEIKSTPKKGISFNLHSIPNYKQDVILSKMLFEKESQYLTVGEAAQLAHAIASLRQGGYVFSVLNSFQNLGVVDSISFTSSEKESSSLYSNSQNSSTQNNMNISAGKYIGDNVYISINKKSEGATFDVDFSLTPTISIKANTSGEAGISWKYRY